MANQRTSLHYYYSLEKGFINMDLNKVELIGRLTADPDGRIAEKAVPCVEMRLVTGYVRKNSDGKVVEDNRDYFTVVAFAKLSIIARRYLKKGDRIYVSGRLRNVVHVSKSGSRRRGDEIVIHQIIMLGSKSQGPTQRN